MSSDPSGTSSLRLSDPRSGTTLGPRISSTELSRTQVEFEVQPQFAQRFEVPEIDLLAADAALQRHMQRQAFLDAVPLGKSFDPETTAAWLDTVEAHVLDDRRYQYPSPDGPTGSEIGRGGVGRILLAVDKHLGREVALKELLPDVAASSQAQTAELRFVREARISGQLGHPNIVTVYDLGRRRDGRLYYTMKLVRGQTFERALNAAKGLEERLALLGHYSSLCQAIAYAHSQGVIHRDIKPENVMIGEFGETVVLDWGGAKVKQRSITAELLNSIPPQPDSPQWIGTPLYMSPEQAMGRNDRVNESSDVWALGVVLYQLLTGRTPFDGRTFSELTRNIENQVPTPILKVEPRVPKELAAIAERALCKDQTGRYPTAREMMQDVDAYRAGGLVSSDEVALSTRILQFCTRHGGTSWVVVLLMIFAAGLALGLELRAR